MVFALRMDGGLGLQVWRLESAFWRSVYCSGFNSCQYHGPIFGTAVVSDTSNTPESDIGNSLGLYIDVVCSQVDTLSSGFWNLGIPPDAMGVTKPNCVGCLPYQILCSPSGIKKLRGVQEQLRGEEVRDSYRTLKNFQDHFEIYSR